MTTGPADPCPPPPANDSDELPPALLALIAALADRQARADYAAYVKAKAGGSN